MQVWDVDLQRHEVTVKDIIFVAQGKMTLEEFLKQVRQSSSQVQPGFGSWKKRKLFQSMLR